MSRQPQQNQHGRSPKSDRRRDWDKEGARDWGKQREEREEREKGNFKGIGKEKEDLIINNPSTSADLLRLIQGQGQGGGSGSSENFHSPSSSSSSPPVPLPSSRISPSQPQGISIFNEVMAMMKIGPESDTANVGEERRETKGESISTMTVPSHVGSNLPPSQSSISSFPPTASSTPLKQSGFTHQYSAFSSPFGQLFPNQNYQNQNPQNQNENSQKLQLTDNQSIPSSASANPITNANSEMPTQPIPPQHINPPISMPLNNNNNIHGVNNNMPIGPMGMNAPPSLPSPNPLQGQGQIQGQPQGPPLGQGRPFIAPPPGFNFSAHPPPSHIPFAHPHPHHQQQFISHNPQSAVPHPSLPPHMQHQHPQHHLMQQQQQQQYHNQHLQQGASVLPPPGMAFPMGYSMDQNQPQPHSFAPFPNLNNINNNNSNNLHHLQLQQQQQQQQLLQQQLHQQHLIHQQQQQMNIHQHQKQSQQSQPTYGMPTHPPLPSNMTMPMSMSQMNNNNNNNNNHNLSMPSLIVPQPQPHGNAPSGPLRPPMLSHSNGNSNNQNVVGRENQQNLNNNNSNSSNSAQVPPGFSSSSSPSLPSADSSSLSADEFYRQQQESQQRERQQESTEILRRMIFNQQEEEREQKERKMKEILATDHLDLGERMAMMNMQNNQNNNINNQQDIHRTPNMNKTKSMHDPHASTSSLLSPPATPATPSSPSAYSSIHDEDANVDIYAPPIMITPSKRRIKAPYSPSVSLDNELKSLANSLRISPTHLSIREKCRRDLEISIQQYWPKAKLLMFGSSVNELCETNSDLDMSLILSSEDFPVVQTCYNSTNVDIATLLKLPTGSPKTDREKKGARGNGMGKQNGNQNGNGKTKREKDKSKSNEREESKENPNFSSPPSSSPSTISMFEGDLDLSLSAPSSSNSDSSSPSTSSSSPPYLFEPGQVVEKLSVILKRSQCGDILALPKARVPIVKFFVASCGLHCDIGINNFLAVKNSLLIRDYMAIEERAKDLALIVKFWAKQRKINDPFRGTLSSYCYVLMIIHFLQTQQPAILPTLQQFKRNENAAEIEKEKVREFDCWYYKDIEKFKGFGSSNVSTLSDLLANFFHFYGFEHEYQRAILSVRMGGFLDRKGKIWRESGKKDRHLLSVEDPFEVTHDLGRVCDKNALYEIRGEMMRGFKNLQERRGIGVIFMKYEKEWRGA